MFLTQESLHDAGADMFLYETAYPTVVRDAHVLEARFPVTDDCQDWTLVDVHENGEFLIVEVSRLLDTGDLQDRAFMDDSSEEIPPHRVIAAFGDSSMATGHGPNNARGIIRWHALGSDEYGDFLERMDSIADGSFVLQAVDYPVKALETEYAELCFSWSDITALGVPDNVELTIVGLEALIHEPTRCAYSLRMARFSWLPPLILARPSLYL